MVAGSGLEGLESDASGTLHDFHGGLHVEKQTNIIGWPDDPGTG
jgi:hypothetical protein